MIQIKAEKNLRRITSTKAPRRLLERKNCLTGTDIILFPSATILTKICLSQKALINYIRLFY